MNLKDVLYLVQICFYISTGILAALTYSRAKKGLLNTVNTEYQKKAMEKLEDLSNRLYDEFNEESPNYWVNQTKTLEIFEPYVEDYRKFYRTISSFNNTERPEYKTRFRSVPETARAIEKILNEVKSEPFIPEVITDLVVEHLENRAKTILQVYFNEGDKFLKELNEGKFDNYNNDWMYVAGMIHNRVNKSLYEKNAGISQVEEQVHEIRREIKKYLSSFDPFSKRRWYTGQSIHKDNNIM